MFAFGLGWLNIGLWTCMVVLHGLLGWLGWGGLLVCCILCLGYGMRFGLVCTSFGVAFSWVCMLRLC